jgi:hypothetical protein
VVVNSQRETRLEAFVATKNLINADHRVLCLGKECNRTGHNKSRPVAQCLSPSITSPFFAVVKYRPRARKGERYRRGEEKWPRKDETILKMVNL